MTSASNAAKNQATPTHGATSFTVAQPLGAQPVQGDVFIARQPIFDARQEVHGYELLFRSSTDNAYNYEDGDTASLQTISNAMHSLGLGAVANGKTAFINITRQLLISEMYTVLPTAGTVIELLETIPIDEEVIEACRQLKRQGYSMALDDFVDGRESEPLIELADMIKIDFRQVPPHRRAALSEQLTARGKTLVAEKVETRAEFQEAVALGHDYIQGYFFCQPEVMRGKSLHGTKLIYMRFLQAISQPGFDLDEIESIIKQDVSLSYQLLRYINSTAMGVRQNIGSIRRALVLLGEQPLRKWGALVAMRHLSRNKPAELLMTCLVRGRFCERVSDPQQPGEQSGEQTDPFLLGLLSCIDAVMDRPLADVLDDLPLAESLKAVLLGEDQGVLSRMHELMLACERGDWRRVIELAEQLQRTQPEIAVLYYDAMRWADQVFQQ